MSVIKVRQGYRGAVRAQYTDGNWGGYNSCSTYVATAIPNYSFYDPRWQHPPGIEYNIDTPKCKGCGARKWIGNICAYCKGVR